MVDDDELLEFESYRDKWLSFVYPSGWSVNNFNPGFVSVKEPLRGGDPLLLRCSLSVMLRKNVFRFSTRDTVFSDNPATDTIEQLESMSVDFALGVMAGFIVHNEEFVEELPPKTEMRHHATVKPVYLRGDQHMLEVESIFYDWLVVTKGDLLIIAAPPVNELERWRSVFLRFIDSLQTMS